MIEHALGCGFLEACKHLAGEPRGACPVPPPKPVHDESEAHALRMREGGFRIWAAALPIAQTIGKQYFRSRAITGPLSTELRFMPELEHWPTRQMLPAIVARVTGASGGFAGVHLTFLTTDGLVNRALAKRKLMLGATGGGAVRLAEPASGELTVAEGDRDQHGRHGGDRLSGVVGVVDKRAQGARAAGLGRLPSRSRLTATTPARKPPHRLRSAGGLKAAASESARLLQGWTSMMSRWRTPAGRRRRFMVDDPDPPGSDPPKADNPIARILTFDPLAGLVERSKADPGAPYVVLPQIAKLWREDLPAYEAMILRLKKESECRVGPLEGAVAALAKRTAGVEEASGRGKEGNGKAKHGGQAQEDKALGAAITFAVLEPWPEPVDGAALLDELVNALRAYVVLAAGQANAAALWIVFTHAHDAFDTSPRLVAKSPQKRSGKTTLFRVLSRLVARPRFLSGITSAALLRVIELHGPTLLIDELDALMAGDKEMAQALRGLINAGFDRAGARLIMNVPTPDGYEPREFSCWAPVALAGIGRLPDTVRDRSIELEMKRKLPTETVQKLRRRDGAELNELARKLVRWTEDNVNALKTAAPTMPDGLNDRAADAWEPLVAVADRAGGSWPGLARAASLTLSGEDLKDDNIDALLLSDIRDVFVVKGGDRITGKSSSPL